MMTDFNSWYFLGTWLIKCWNISSGWVALQTLVTWRSRYCTRFCYTGVTHSELFAGTFGKPHSCHKRHCNILQTLMWKYCATFWREKLPQVKTAPLPAAETLHPLSAIEGEIWAKFRFLFTSRQRWPFTIRLHLVARILIKLPDARPRWPQSDGWMKTKALSRIQLVAATLASDTCCVLVRHWDIASDTSCV